jgi:hypothetical protein
MSRLMWDGKHFQRSALVRINLVVALLTGPLRTSACTFGIIDLDNRYVDQAVDASRHGLHGSSRRSFVGGAAVVGGGEVLYLLSLFL